MVPLEIGGNALFNALAYSPPNQQTVQFIEQRLMEKLSSFGSMVTDFGKSFMDKSLKAFNDFHGSDALRAAQAAMRKAGTYFQSNTIRPLRNIEELQTAPEKMQRYLMADIETRELFHAQRIDGYSGTYVDMHPNDIGRGHYDYRRVVEGMLLDDDENDFKVSYFFEDPVEGDIELNHEQKVDVLNAWDLMRQYREATRDDGTSIFGNKI